MGAYTRSRRLVPTTKFHRRAQMSVADVDRNGLSKCGARVSPKALASTEGRAEQCSPRHKRSFRGGAQAQCVSLNDVAGTIPFTPPRGRPTANAAVTSKTQPSTA